jgi:hypothetical protein
VKSFFSARDPCVAWPITPSEKKENNNQRSFGCWDLNASERTRRELPSAGFDLSLGKKRRKE